MSVLASPHGLATKATECDDDGRWPRRSGTWRTGIAHIITAVIGSGVLSLGWSVAQLGWLGGPLVLLSFSVLTWYAACLLCEAYRTDGLPTGKRNYTYQEVVSQHLGPVNAFFCSVIQHLNLVATGVGYTVTGSLSLTAAKRAVCFHHFDSDPNAPCAFANNPWLLMFGGMQIVFSQIPNFGQLWWLSYLATAMSFAYAFIGLGLSIGKATEKGHADYGTITGVNHGSDTSPAAASWNIFVALGSVAFAYSFSMVLIEVQDTLAQEPSEIESMKKATGFSIAITTFFYMSIGCISYAGFGNASPSNLVTGFGFFEPFWLVGAANVFVFVHLLGAYQVFLQPFMAFVEESVYKRAPQMRRDLCLQIPAIRKLQISPFRLASRTLIVCFTTFLAILLPFFNDLVGILGSLGFWPLTIYFPIECHLATRGVTWRQQKWWWLQAISFFTLLITIVSLIGSVEFVIQDLKDVRLFDSVSSGSAAAT